MFTSTSISRELLSFLFFPTFSDLILTVYTSVIICKKERVLCSETKFLSAASSLRL